jgi:putative flippase GtrA
VIAGSIVAAVYLGLPVGLNDGAGVPVEAAIPIAFALALTLHFTLQRTFVFRHVATFALSTRAQIRRYCVIAAVQYPTTAALTALLPGLLHLSQRDCFVIITLSMSLFSFTMLRTRIFHSHRGPAPPQSVGTEGSAADLQVRKEQFLRERRMASEAEPDPVQAGMH